MMKTDEYHCKQSIKDVTSDNDSITFTYCWLVGRQNVGWISSLSIGSSGRPSACWPGSRLLGIFGRNKCRQDFEVQEV